MVPVAADHAATLSMERLPGFIADVLQPDFFEDRRPISRRRPGMARLRIVRSAHDVAMEFVAKDARVAALAAAGHGLAHDGKV